MQRPSFQTLTLTLELYDDSYRKLVQVTPGSGSHLTQVAWRYEENSCREELQGV